MNKTQNRVPADSSRRAGRIRDIILFFCFAAAIVLLDQKTKDIAARTLASEDIILIPGVLRLTLVLNTGAAFGSFSGKTAFLAFFTVFLLALCVWVYWRIAGRSGVRMLKVTVVMIFSGGLGNFIDRAFRGAVTDFIYFEMIDFPVFNTADCFVTVGALLLLFSAFTVYRNREMRELLGFPARKNADSGE